MSEHREESRRERDELWDKTFDDNEDLDSEGHLSRTEHRRQRSHNSTITTVLIVLIIILAAAPVIYWVNNRQSFNHPVRTEQRAASKSVSSKKKQRSRTSAKKRQTASSTVTNHSQSSSTSVASSQSQATVASSSVRTSSSSVSSTRTTGTRSGYVTVQRGESIDKVAARNGLTPQELARLNNMTVRSTIHPGQQLRVK